MSFFDLGLGLSDAATGGLISAGGSLLGGLLGSGSAQSAANTQAQSAQNALDFQKQQFATTQAQGAPYRGAGYNALNTLGGLGSGTYQMYDAQGNPTGTGTGTGYLTKEYTPADFAQGIDPGYQFRLQQGQEATNRMANMGGGLISGNALKGAEDYTQGLASQEYGNAFNRFQTNRGNIYNTLAGIAGLGNAAYGTSASAGTSAANTIGNTIQGIGQAQAAGTVGASNAISGGLQNAGNQYYLSQLLSNKTPGVNYSLGGGIGYTPVAPITQPGVDMGGAQGLSSFKPQLG
jgi:hypothetical protein